MDIPEEMAQALAEHSGELISIGGVNGFDIGLDPSGQLAMRILVTDRDDPPPGLPNTIGGFPVILMTGGVILDSALPDVVKEEPVIGGTQLAFATPLNGELEAGTLGCVLRGQGQNPVAVTCGHVLNRAAGSPVQQPAPSSDPPSIFEKLGNLIHCEVPSIPPLVMPPALPIGYMDAAVCSIDPPNPGGNPPGRMPSVGRIKEIGTVTGIGWPHIGDSVCKRGFRTGLSCGVISGMGGTHLVYERDPDPSNPPKPKWWLLGITTITAIPVVGNALGVWSKSGDSGSVVVRVLNGGKVKEIVALHVGGSYVGGSPDGMTGYAIPFPTVALAFGLTL